MELRPDKRPCIWKPLSTSAAFSEAANEFWLNSLPPYRYPQPKSRAALSWYTFFKMESGNPIP